MSKFTLSITLCCILHIERPYGRRNFVDSVIEVDVGSVVFVANVVVVVVLFVITVVIGVDAFILKALDRLVWMMHFKTSFKIDGLCYMV